MANRMLIILSWADGVLATLLPLLYIAWSKGGRRPIPASAYRWAFGGGAFLCLAWWLLLILRMRTLLGGSGAVGVIAYSFLPPTILGIEVGVAGFMGLPRRWSLFPLAFGSLNARVVVTLLAYMVGVRLR